MANERANTPIPAAPENTLQSSRPVYVINAKFFNTRNLSIAVTGIVLCVALIKADSKDIPQIVNTLVNSGRFSIFGWFIAVIILVASIILIRIMCKIYDREIERLVKERDQLQAKLLENSGKAK